MAGPAPSESSRALEFLQRLEAVLQAESEALKTLDLTAIDTATREKEALQPQLHAALDALRGQTIADEIRHELLETRSRVVAHAKRNQTRLMATHGAVKSLVGAMTTPTPVTYGRRKNPYGQPARAVLTVEVG